MATDARLSSPYGVALDGKGNVYIADTYNNRIRKVTLRTDMITTIYAFLSGPRGVAVDELGNICIADTYNNRVSYFIVSTRLYTSIADSDVVKNPSDVAFD